MFTYFRLFINLENVDSSKGPLHIFSVKNSKLFSKKHEYKSRFNYKKFGNEDETAFKNVGKKVKHYFLILAGAYIEEEYLMKEKQEQCYALFLMQFQL